MAASCFTDVFAAWAVAIFPLIALITVWATEAGESKEERHALSGKSEAASPALESGQTSQLLTIRPDLGDASLLWASEEWAVWRKSQMIEETRGNRAPSFNHWYYRQRLSERKLYWSIPNATEGVPHVWPSQPMELS